MIVKCKENIYANIQEQNITKYIPAAGISKCYAVTFTREKVYTLFGKVIKTQSKSETMPFVFKSLDIAKDFCKICPTVISDVFINSHNYYKVKYETYRLVKNEKILGYIKWNAFYTYDANLDYAGQETHKRYTQSLSDPIVDKFVEDIVVKDWVHTNSIKDIKFLNESDSLSELINKVENKNNLKKKSKEVYKEWNFKLVES